MVLMTDRNARAVLAARLEPGENLLFHAYGVKQPGRVKIVLMYMFCLMIPAAFLLRRFTTHFLVGLTDRRLVVVRFVNLEAPDEVVAFDRASTQASGKQGWFWTHLELKDAQRTFAAKFHRAALPHNRTQARDILEAMSGQVVAV